MSNADQRVLIAILTYNCHSKIDSLSKIITNFKENINFKIYIFDDCSNSLTQSKLKKLFLPNKLLISDTNLGYGGNVKRAFEYCEKNNFDILAIFPGDMQRDINDLRKMIEIGIKEKYDVVVGTKDKNKLYGRMPVIRKFGNFLLNLISRLWKDNTAATLSGFKVYNVNSCKKIIWLCQSKFGFDLDFSFWASQNNLKLHPHPASVSYENHFSSVKSTTLQGITLILRGLILGLFLQPLLYLLKMSLKRN